MPGFCGTWLVGLGFSLFPPTMAKSLGFIGSRVWGSGFRAAGVQGLGFGGVWGYLSWALLQVGLGFRA